MLTNKFKIVSIDIMAQIGSKRDKYQLLHENAYVGTNEDDRNMS